MATMLHLWLHNGRPAYPPTLTLLLFLLLLLLLPRDVQTTFKMSSGCKSFLLQLVLRDRGGMDDEQFDDTFVSWAKSNGWERTAPYTRQELPSSDEEDTDVPRWMKTLVQTKRGALIYVQKNSTGLHKIDPRLSSDSEDERIFWGFNHPDQESEKRELLNNETYFKKFFARARLRMPWLFTRKCLKPSILESLGKEFIRIAYLKKSPRVSTLLHDRQRQAIRASLIQQHLNRNVLYDENQFAPSSSVKPYQSLPRYLYIEMELGSFALQFAWPSCLRECLELMFAAKSGSLDGLKLPHRNFRSTVLQIGETLDPHLVRHFEKETLRHDNACEEGYGMLYRRRVVDEQELNFPGALVLVLSSEIEVPSDLVAVASLSHGFKVVEVLSRLDVDADFRCVTPPDISFAKCKLQIIECFGIGLARPEIYSRLAALQST